MSVSASDMVFRKSNVVTDTGTNGGPKGSVEVVSGVRHALFPRVTKSERDNGVTRYRKEFLANENADDESAYGVLVWLELPSTAGDRFYLRTGTQDDTQANLTAHDPLRLGTGQIQSAVTAGDESVSITMENSDFVFPNGEYLHIANKVMTGQTVADGVKVGDSVNYNETSAQWEKISYTDDIAYPNGLCVGSDLVMSTDDDTTEEWVQIALNLTEDEAIGAGDGVDTSPTLSTLANVTNGICRKKGVDAGEASHPVVVTAPPTGGGDDMKARFNPDGTLDTANSDASAGELSMTDGTWTTDITWDTAPASGSDNITVTYAENSYSYFGNVVTVSLGEQIANDYNADQSAYAGACLYVDEVACTYDEWSESAAGDGTYDESTYPPSLYNDGTVEDDWTITFSSGSAFSCTGVKNGSVGSGSISANFSPNNPDTNQPYFTMDLSGWAGTWAAGDTVQFSTHPSALPLWLEEVVPVGTSQEPNNLLVVGWYCE
ncbi:MAG: hypothetical protein SWH61_03275 [Thermodesulfobacteriota bacterium]|nr:hypothetical protein [Thermodesulfobacteriota bacterium]